MNEENEIIKENKEEIEEESYSDSDLDSEIDLDNNWIDDFEEIDKMYADFYLEDVSCIKAHFIYVNNDRSIEKVKKEKIFLQQPNLLSKEEILMLFKKNMIDKNSIYFLSAMLKYNITLDSSDVRKYCMSSYNPEEYVTRISTIDDITFKKTITMFQDLNHLFFIFIEKPKGVQTNKSKRANISKTNNYNKTHRKQI
jgi:hypothetical protein